MSDREISLPFAVNGSGRIATTNDPSEIGRQHLTSFLLTDPGERVMRPEYGTGVRNMVFEPLDGVTAPLLLARVREKVGANVRDVVLKDISTPLDATDGTLQLTVEFALRVGAAQGTTQQTTITVGGVN